MRRIGPHQFRNHPVAALGAFALAMVFPAGLLCGATEELVLNHPEHPIFHSNALDQPRLYGILTRDGEVIQSEGQEVVFRAFIDTGASSFAISNLHVDDFGFTSDDFVGEYTNLGLGGEEVGDVTETFGVRVHNEPTPLDGDADLEDFIPYGEFNLWVRRSPGLGESLGGFSNPINIVGMPVIEQRVMVMNWVPLFEGLEEVETKLLDRENSGIPETNVTLDVRMEDFVGEAREGEVLPSSAKNPLVTNVTISHDPEQASVTGDWLFDTGAGSSFISFDYALAIGLADPEIYGPEDFEQYVTDHQESGGIISEVGGIGDEVIQVPVVLLNEVRIPAREGFDVVWENVMITVFDHPELAELGLLGIFGMNLIGPSMTLDSGSLESGSQDLVMFDEFGDISPSPFRSIVFEVTGEETGELRLFTERELPDAVATSFADWREENFGEDASDDGISGPAADPGDYGIPNLLRYAFDLDPHRPRHDRLPEVTPAPDSAEGFAIEFRRLRNDVSVEYRVERSTDLRNWEPAEATWTVLEIDGASERVSVRIDDPAESRGGFFRVRVRKVDE